MLNAFASTLQFRGSKLVTVALLTTFQAGAPCETVFAAPVVSGEARVVDGDTVVVSGEKIRLNGIDAPETDQLCLTSRGDRWTCGIEARNRLVAKTAG